MHKVFCGLVSTWVLGAAAEDEVDGGDDPVRDQGWAKDGHQGRGCVVGRVSVVVVVEPVGDGSQIQKGSVVEVIRIQRDDQMFTVRWSEVEWRRIWSQFLYL